MPTFTASNSLDVVGSHVITGGLSIGSSVEQNYGLNITQALADTSSLTSFSVSTQGMSLVPGITISTSTVNIASTITNLSISSISTMYAGITSISSSRSNVTLTKASSFEISGVPTLAGTVANFAAFTSAYGLKISSSSTYAATAYGAYIDAPTGTGTRWALYVGSGNSYFNGNVGIATTIPGSELDVKGTLRLSGSSSGYVGFVSPPAPTSITYTLPPAGPTNNGYVLSSATDGTMSWVASAGGGGSSTYTKTCNFVGPISVQNGTLRWYPDQSITVTSVYINVSTAPTSGPFSISVKKNGATITNASLSTGSYTSSVTAVNVAFTSSDYVTIDVTASNGAVDAAVILLYTRT